MSSEGDDGLVDKGVEEGVEIRVSREGTMSMASAPAVQRLYDVCKKVFTSTGVPSEAQVSNVRAVLGIISHHLILDKTDRSFDRNWSGATG